MPLSAAMTVKVVVRKSYQGTIISLGLQLFQDDSYSEQSEDNDALQSLLNLSIEHLPAPDGDIAGVQAGATGDAEYWLALLVDNSQPEYALSPVDNRVRRNC